MSDYTPISTSLPRTLVNSERTNHKINILVKDNIDKLIGLCDSLPSNQEDPELLSLMKTVFQNEKQCLDSNFDLIIKFDLIQTIQEKKLIKDDRFIAIVEKEISSIQSSIKCLSQLGDEDLKKAYYKQTRSLIELLIKANISKPKFINLIRKQINEVGKLYKKNESDSIHIYSLIKYINEISFGHTSSLLKDLLIIIDKMPLSNDQLKTINTFYDYCKKTDSDDFKKELTGLRLVFSNEYNKDFSKQIVSFYKNSYEENLASIENKMTNINIAYNNKLET